MYQATLVEPARARLAWLANPTLLLCIAGVVLPNALSLVALAGGIGSPPRTMAILAYAMLAFAIRFVPRVLTIVLYLAIVAYDAISTIALLFNLAPDEIGTALRFGAELKLFQSPLYVMLISGLAVLVGANVALLTLKRDTLRRGNAAIMLAAALALAATDFITNTSAHYQFGTLYGANKPMESAGLASGFRPVVLNGKRNVLLVVVEALGEFADPERQAILLQPFRDPQLRARYDVTVGSNTYYGSTTAAEMRELCNTREPYEAVIEGKDFNCLPRQLAARGYRTVALHNFTSKFFQREEWYPKLGFQKRIFLEDLGGSVHRLCGGPFRGPCDTDMIPIIANELRDATKPTFLYWMTLGTHVPIAPREGTPRLGCDHGGGSMRQMEVCYMTEMWLDVFQSIAAMTADIPPTEILIVGDHAPPLWSKAGRQLFTPGQVTWIRLTPRAASHVSRAR